MKEPSGGREPSVKEPSRDRKGVVIARVLEELPSLVWRVELEEGRQLVLAHAVGTVKRNFVRLLPGDRVEVDVSPNDRTRGRIVRKIENEGTRIGKKDL